RYVPQLAFLHILLGDDPPLPVGDLFYQRLLAGDADEAADLAEKFINDKTPTRLCDDLIVPTLRRAKHDAREGVIDTDHENTLIEGIREVIDELVPDTVHASPPGASQNDQRFRVLCIPARVQADGVAASMLERLMTNGTIVAKALTTEDLGLDL